MTRLTVLIRRIVDRVKNVFVYTILELYKQFYKMVNKTTQHEILSKNFNTSILFTLEKTFKEQEKNTQLKANIIGQFRMMGKYFSVIENAFFYKMLF